MIKFTQQFITNTSKTIFIKMTSRTYYFNQRTQIVQLVCTQREI